MLGTGSFDANAGIWRRWEGTSGYVKGRKGEEDQGMAVETDFTGEAEEDLDEEDEEWAFAAVLEGHDSEVKSIAFSPTSPLIATCSRDKSIWIWEDLDNDDYETVAVLQEHEGDVKCVAWHPDEELLASSSYDDNIRLWREDIDDWACCACIEGHKGTVWSVEFEGKEVSERGPVHKDGVFSELDEAQKAVLEERQKAGPRLLSCSDDLSIRIWRRISKDKPDQPTGQGRMPSIIKTNSIEEEWVEVARLPQAHERAVYAASWSRHTGRIVSCSSDGKIVVYEEQWVRSSTNATNGANDAAMPNADSVNDESNSQDSLAQWVVVAEFENAHEVFEVNHVCWAKRYDKARQDESEEVVITTGDDGEVRVWELVT